MSERAEDFVIVLDMKAHAELAIRWLTAAGVPRQAIDVLSAEPLALDGTYAAQTTKSRIPIFAIIGGVLGAAGAITLTVFASRSVGLVTGGMPIVAPWPLGIIVFELTALGAILATLGRMIYEARLARTGRAGEYGKDVAKDVADERIVIVVRDDYRDMAERVLTGRRCWDVPLSD